MARRILSVILGVITGMIIVFIGDATCHKLYSSPDGIEHMSREQVSQYVAGIPLYVKVLMMVFWIMSSFFGGFITAKVNKLVWRVPTVITGSILMVASVMNMALIPHPLWMWVGALLLYIPAAWLGGFIAVKNSRAVGR